MAVSIVTNESNMDMMARYADGFFDLAIVDPPYGNIGSDIMNLKNNNLSRAKRTQVKPYDNIPTGDDYFTELRRVSKHQIIWGANFFGLKGGYICWNKNGTAFGQAELAYCSMQKSVSVFEYTWNGMIQGDMKNKEKRIHNHQKPVALYRWLLFTYAKPGFKILDTHLGSGSSRIAAHSMDFDFYACELDTDYFNNQEARFDTYLKQQQLFMPSPEIIQTEIFNQ
jgi:site-specific DNA-methyltransferase (adenine-specific)